MFINSNFNISFIIIIIITQENKLQKFSPKVCAFLAILIFTKHDNFQYYFYLMTTATLPSTIVYTVIAQINHVTTSTKEMQNCIDEKSILAVLEQIHSKLPMEQRKLWETVGDETKVGGSEKKVAYCILGTHTVQEH